MRAYERQVMNRIATPPGFARPAFVPEAERVFRELVASRDDVEQVDAVLVDLNGIMRGKRMPVSDAAGRLFESGMQIPHSVYLMDPRGEMTNPFGRGVGDGDPDGTAWPIPESIRLAWTGAVPRIQMLMTLRDDNGAVDPAEPRAALERVLERFHEARLTPVAAVELEFHLVDRERTEAGAPKPPARSRDAAHAVYDTADLDRYGDFLSALAAAARLEGVPLNCVSSEYGPGQFEANLAHQRDVLAAADHAIFLKRLVRAVAQATGLEATFMAKPYPSRAGSGLHVHVSLLDRDDRNVFDDGSLSGSPVLRNAIAGLQALMPESMALFAPSVNSYRRFQPDMFAPVNRRWGVNNRSVGIRVPAGPEQARRLEHRAAGADANPYFVLAAVLAGIHHGLATKTDPGAPASGNVSRERDPELSLSIEDALARLRAARTLPSYLGEETLRLYAESKRLELERFRRIVPPHEYVWYL